MANPHRGEARISIGGKERTLRFDHNAFAEIEEALGLDSLFELLRERPRALLGSRLLRVVIAVGVKHEAPVSVEVAGDWLSTEPERLGEFISAAQRALLSAYRGPQASEEVRDASRPLPAGTGPSDSETPRS